MKNFDTSALTFDVALEDVINDGVYVFLHILHQDRKAVLDGHLELTQEVAVAERHHLSGEAQIDAGTHTQYTHAVMF